MRNVLIAVILVSFTMVGCDASLDGPDNPMNERALFSRYISSSEACDLADEALACFGYGSSGRASRSSFARLYRMANPYSRTFDTDSTFFVVEYVGGGYVVVAAERNAEPNVIAVSNEGFFSEDDNPNLQYYMEWAAENLSIVAPPYLRPPRDSIVHSFCDSTITYCDRFINTRWTQWAPYNKYCPYASNGLDNCPVGCAALAACQIFSFHKRPTEYQGYTYDWDAILMNNVATSSTEDDIAMILSDFGEVSNMKYTDTLSTANPSNVLAAMKTFGFEGAKRSLSLDKSLVSLKEFGPNMMFGFVDSPGEKGHAWVVDGAKIVSRYQLVPDLDAGETRVELPPHYYLHMKWGFGGSSDGYYFVDNSDDAEVLGFKRFQYIIDIN